jgi:hypothetical protein
LLVVSNSTWLENFRRLQLDYLLLEQAMATFRGMMQISVYVCNYTSKYSGCSHT